MLSLVRFRSAAWQEFFIRRLNVISAVEKIDVNTLQAIHKYYGGNAKAMEILSSAIQQDYDSDIKAYWQANQKYLPSEGELEDLVNCQFQRLAKQNLAAYNLLCRLGCYRYQDVATVPLEGIFSLLWDVPEREQMKTVNILRDRSLIEFSKGEYWLHPVIRAEAVSKLKKSDDWEKANRQAAQFWTESVETIKNEEDAFQAFEAYHHYLEVNDIDAASLVITNNRENSWDEDETLGTSFYRLGLLQKMILAINSLVTKISCQDTLMKITNILGDIYWLIGDLKQGIKYHQLSGEVAHKVNKKRYEAFSTYNQGLCYIDYFELNIAVDCFKQTILLTQGDKDIEKFYMFECSFCLSFLKSSLGLQEEARALLSQYWHLVGKVKASSWNQGYSLLFIGQTYKNLGQLTEAFEIYHRAIKYAEESNYTQVKAKSLTGLAELYRLQKEFTTALSHHTESIEMLDKIGAKCDLAEAYFQLALTYQDMEEIAKSRENFEQAIQLFKNIPAPKQIERVQQAIKR